MRGSARWRGPAGGTASELEARGVDWTVFVPSDPPQARGTSDEGPPPQAAKPARRRLKAGRKRAGGTVLALLWASLAAGCGSQVAPATTPALQVQTAPLSTSLVTPQGTWAVTVMGGSAAAENNFWQLFVRPAGASRWSLATPEGVADNGGLVATSGAGGSSLLVGFRPSQGLTFSPLATSSDTGRSWTPGLLDAGLADVPDAMAVAPSGQTLALLHDGGIETAATTGAAAAGQWSRLATLATLAASAPGRSCGLVAVNAVSFSQNNVPMAAGSCVRRGVAGVFADTGGAWQAAGPVLPAGFGGDQVQVLGLARTLLANAGLANAGLANAGLANGGANTGGGDTEGGNAALLLAGNDLLAAWSDGGRWTVSAPVAAAAGDEPGDQQGVRAAGFGADGSLWVLLGGDRAETVSGPGASWQALPPVPAGTQVLVPAGTATLAPGSGGYDALAVSGSRLTVWQLTGAAWARAQVINVPIEYGSSG